MVIQVNILIYVYMALCACMLVFNAVYVGRRRWWSARRPRQNGKWKEFLLKSMENGGLPDKKQERYLNRKLSRPASLMVFNKAVLELRREGGGQMDLWIQNNREIFIKIGRPYMKGRPAEQSYYAYTICQYNLCKESEGDVITRRMLELVMSLSTYVRENALQALYASGKKQLVVKAYLLMVRKEIRHSAKMVTDGLMDYRGNSGDLAEALWDNWTSFTPYYQTAFINFIRMVDGGFCSRFLPILDSGADREIKFAVIRYFRKYYLDSAGELLRRYLLDEEDYDWEFTALAAAALENYPCEETIKALIGALGSGNWYVRDNASDALVKIASGNPMLQDVLVGEDRYASEMLKYKLDNLRMLQEAAMEEKESDTDDGCN